LVALKRRLRLIEGRPRHGFLREQRFLSLQLDPRQGERFLRLGQLGADNVQLFQSLALGQVLEAGQRAL